MTRVKQITAWIGSSPGQLARIIKALADARISVTAFTAYEIEKEGPVRLQVNDVAKAKQVLERLGVRYTEEEVLRLTLNNKPGILAEVTRRLADVDINIEYSYFTVTSDGKKVDIVMGVSDLVGAATALQGL